MATWLRRRLSLKSRAEVCPVYIFLLILYRLSVLLSEARWLALQRLFWGGRLPMVRRQVCIQCTRNRSLGMPDLKSHWFAERLAYLGRSLSGDAVWRQKASDTFPHLKSNPKTEDRHWPMGEALFVRECLPTIPKLLESSDFSRLRKELYQELVLRTLSESGMVGRRGDPVPLELGVRFGLLEPLRYLARLVACTERIASSWLELQSRPGRHARLSSLWQWPGGNGWARLLLQRASSPVLGSLWGVDSSHQIQTARAARRWLRRRQRLTSVSGWEACGVSHDPSCGQNGDLDDTKKGIVWRCKLFLSWSDIVL